MPLPVIDVAQMRAWEAATWAAGRSEAEVIERAGQAVAQRARQLAQPGERILVLAGKGHNGDDARRAASHLAGRAVELLNLTSPETESLRLQQLLEQRPALIIDGLFGIGLDRPLGAAWMRVIQAMNRSAVPILSVDLPSGLNADTGESMGAVVNATLTLTLGAPKKGLVAARARSAVGRLEVAATIGLVPCPHQSELNWTLPEDFIQFPPPRAADSHKGTFGHLVILAGSRGYHGAAVLAARGALNARPGLVTVWTPEGVYVPIAAQLQAAMVEPWRADLKPPDSITALLIGPGLAARDLPEGMQDAVRVLWQTAPWPVVVDASALDWLPPGQRATDALRLVTPHPGEAARMLESSAGKVQDDRPAALRELSRGWGGCWVVLKGQQTLVGRSEGELYLNPSGNPSLAQGGSGDVLAGYLAGLLAQPPLQANPQLTIRYGVWQHGAAADRLEAARTNWQIEHLARLIGSVKPGAEFASSGG